ncbi:MAG: DMT family transporter [Sulfolobales archaeon]
MLGYVAITIASVMWSLNPAVVSRFKVFIRPVTYTAMRAVTALLFLAPMVTLGGIDLRNDSTHALVVIVLSAIIGPGLGDALYTRSIQLIGGSLAVLISYTYIFVAQAVATITIGESLKYTVFIGSTMAFTGIAVAVLKSEDTIKLDLRGLVYAVAAALLWGIATVMIKMALTYADTLSLTFVRLLVIATTFLPVGLAIEGPPPKAHLRPLLIASSITGVLGWGVGMYLFVYSILAIGVSATAIATALTPVLSQISTKLLAGEHPGLRQVLGALLISIGIVLSMLQ